MKKVILKTLKHDKSSSKSMTVKQLKKLVKNELADKYDENELTMTLDTLVKKSKVILDNDTYRYNGSKEDNQKGDDNDKKELKDDTPKSNSNNNKRKHVETADQSCNSKSKISKANEHYVTSDGVVIEELWKNGERFWRENLFDSYYLNNNPDNITRLFCGNLNKTVTAEQLQERLPGITYTKWITDKQTGEFYGSSFLEMKDAAAAAFAVQQDRSKFLGRPLKIYYCPPRPGDVWPPRASSDGRTSSLPAQPPRREKTPKPPGCKKLYMGNLSYNIDDDTIVDFFKDCGGEIVGLRWLTHKGTEEFRGCGFIEFESSEVADEAIKLDNTELLGRCYSY